MLLFGAVAFVVSAHAPRRVGGDLGRLSRRDRLVAVSIGGRRLHRRPHLGRERDALRARHAARLPLAAKFVVGTDIFHAAALLLVAGLGHLVAGNVDAPAIGWLLVGSIPGVLIGSQISVGLPETGLRMALATALALSGLKLLDVPYANEIVVVSLGAGLVALVVWGIVHLARRSTSQKDVSSSPPQALRPSKNSGDS